MDQLEKDCKWLEERNICDYSFLVGFHFLSSPETVTEDLFSDRVCMWNKNSGGILAKDNNGDTLNEVYFFGLIDILTQYDLKKKSEHALKSILYDDTKLSAISPTPYKKRFLEYISSIVE